MQSMVRLNDSAMQTFVHELGAGQSVALLTAGATIVEACSQSFDGKQK